jgi:hypothetical protein
MKRSLALAFAIASLSWCGAVRADPRDVVYFGGTCLPEGVEHAALSRILAAELSPRAVAPLAFVRGTVGADVVVLALDECASAPPSVRITVWHGVERRERTVALADIPREDLTRTLALALAETDVDPAVSRPVEPAPIPWVAPAVASPPPPSLPTPPPPESATRPGEEPAWKLRASLAFRYATASSTPAGGAAAGIVWPRFGFGASVFGARGSVPVGDVTLWAVSATAFYDLAQLSRHFALRGSLETGAAIATGAPKAQVRGDTAVAFHAALHGGVFGVFRLGDTNDLEGGLSIGYASSLRAQADGADVVSLDGLLLTAEIGLRFR